MSSTCTNWKRFSRYLLPRGNNQGSRLPAARMRAARLLLPKWSSAQCANHVVLHAGARENVRTHHVDVAVAKALGTIANYLVALPFVDGVGQRVRAQRSFLLDRSCCLWTIYRDTAGENKLPDLAPGTVDHAYGFHNARRTSDIDLPHAFRIENSGAQGVQNECKMNYGLCPGLPKQLDKLPARGFTAQVGLLESCQSGTVGRARVTPTT